tara:strand:- start:84 stop:332 length:249 start_codon:yes stop_codon:yes gene_type:complete
MKILKFYAEWCGPCQTYAPIFESVTKEANVEVVNVDIDKDKEGLAAEYKVRSVPTTIFLKEDGDTIRKVGLLTRSQLTEIIK